MIQKQAWQKLWADVLQLHKDVQGRFTETRLEGTLTAKEGSKVHTGKTGAVAKGGGV